MLISARYGIHGLNPGYALRVCSSGRAAVTAAAATKARERGIGVQRPRGGTEGRAMAAEPKGRRGRKRTTRRDATRDRFRVVQRPPRRERGIFFHSGQTITGCHKSFQPGTLSPFITLGLQFFFGGRECFMISFSFSFFFFSSIIIMIIIISH